MNARRHLCFGSASHPHRRIRIRSELLLLLLLSLLVVLAITFLALIIVTAQRLLQLHFLRGAHACFFSLLVFGGKKHEFQLFDLGVQLVKHVLLHGQHLIFDLHLLLRVLLGNLLHFDLGLQLGHLACVGAVRLPQIVDLLLQTLHFRLLPRQVVLLELLLSLLKH